MIRVFTHIVKKGTPDLPDESAAKTPDAHSAAQRIGFSGGHAPAEEGGFALKALPRSDIMKQGDFVM